MQNKKDILFPLLIYTIISVGSIFSTGGFENVHMTTDFNHYHSFWHEYTNLKLSDLSNNIYDSSSKANWLPNPFYSIIALFPITIFGSATLLKFIGFSLGCLYLKLLSDLNIKLNTKFDFWKLNIFLLIICTNRWFIKESIGLGSVFLSTLFFILGIKISKNIYKSIFFTFAILCRPNFILFFLPFSLIILIKDLFNRKSLSKISKSFILPLIIYPFWYFFIDSNYPGSQINYLFLTESQGIDFAHEAFTEVLKLYTDFEIPDSLLYWELNLTNFFKILFSHISIICSLIQIFILKLFAFLGMRFEYAFLQKYSSFWQISELWISLHFLIFILPGFMFTFIFMLFTRKDSLEFIIYFSSLFYSISNSMLIGDPRYAILVIPVFVYSFLNGLTKLRNSTN